MSDRLKLGLGLGATALGLFTSLVAAFLVHAAEAEELNELGQEVFAWMPRGVGADNWILATLFQSISVGGVLLAIGGLTLAFLYDRQMTWARAALGAFLFVSFLFVIFGIIPNQFLTLTQSTLEWTPQRIFVTIPPVLVLGNDVAISYAALKDILLQGFVGTMLIAIPVFMYWWQGREERAARPKPTPVSEYGRPMRVAD